MRVAAMALTVIVSAMAAAFAVAAVAMTVVIAAAVSAPMIRPTTAVLVEGWAIAG